MTISEKYRRVVVYIPNDAPELYDHLRLEAARQRKRMGQLAGEYIRQGLDKEGRIRADE